MTCEMVDGNFKIYLAIPIKNELWVQSKLG
jgi:hypothetical protein